MIVSLEAIFLSTFVMISQNRADAKRQVLADQQWKTVQEEDRQNKQLIDLSNQILSLTRMSERSPARHRRTTNRTRSSGPLQADAGTDEGRPRSRRRR